MLLLRQLLVASQTVWMPKGRTDNFGLAWENVTLRFTATIQSIACFMFLNFEQGFSLEYFLPTAEQECLLYYLHVVT